VESAIPFLYIVSEYPDEYKSILESQFYSIDTETFIKKYPKNIDNIEKIKMKFIIQKEIFNMLPEVCFGVVVAYGIVNIIDFLLG
jgi:hypothetical protein